jgi:hypothetical protein
VRSKLIRVLYASVYVCKYSHYTFTHLDTEYVGENPILGKYFSSVPLVVW